MCGYQGHGLQLLLTLELVSLVPTLAILFIFHSRKLIWQSVNACPNYVVTNSLNRDISTKLWRETATSCIRRRVVWQLYNATDFILTKIEVPSMKQCMPSMCLTFICNLPTPQRPTLSMTGNTAPCCAGSERTWSQEWHGAGSEH